MSRRIIFAIVIAFLAGTIIGVVIGPRVHVMYWTAILDRYPNNWIKFKAAARLGESESGKDVLYSRLGAGSRAIREPSVYQLASTQKAVYVVDLFGKLPTDSLDDKLQVIRCLNYGDDHMWVLCALTYEFKHTKSQQLKEEIGKELRSVREADARILKNQ